MVPPRAQTSFIPDTSLNLFVSSVDPSGDPTQSEFRLRNINDLDGCDDKTTAECQLGLEKHANGNMDCAGFQRSPKFCENTDRSMGTGCFTVPADLATGRYVFQWYWEFNAGSFYSTCYDAEVVSPGTGNGGGGTTGTPDVTAGSGLEGACTNNFFARFDGSDNAADDDDDETGPGDDEDDSSDVTAPSLSGNDFTFVDAPEVVAAGSDFEMTISYVSTGGRTFFAQVGDRYVLTAALPAASDATELVLTATLNDDINDGSNLLTGWIVADEFAELQNAQDYEETRRERNLCVGDDATACTGSSSDPAGNGDGSGGDGSSDGNVAAAASVSLLCGIAFGVCATVLYQKHGCWKNTRSTNARQSAIDKFRPKSKTPPTEMTMNAVSRKSGLQNAL